MAKSAFWHYRSCLQTEECHLYVLQNAYVMIVLLLFYFIFIVDLFSSLKNKNSDFWCYDTQY